MEIWGDVTSIEAETVIEALIYCKTILLISWATMKQFMSHELTAWKVFLTSMDCFIICQWWNNFCLLCEKATGLYYWVCYLACSRPFYSFIKCLLCFGEPGIMPCPHKTTATEHMQITEAWNILKRITKSYSLRLTLQQQPQLVLLMATVWIPTIVSFFRSPSLGVSRALDLCFKCVWNIRKSESRLNLTFTVHAGDLRWLYLCPLLSKARRAKVKLENSQMAHKPRRITGCWPRRAKTLFASFCELLAWLLIIGWCVRDWCISESLVV